MNRRELGLVASTAIATALVVSVLTSDGFVSGRVLSECRHESVQSLQPEQSFLAASSAVRNRADSRTNSGTGPSNRGLIEAANRTIAKIQSEKTQLQNKVQELEEDAVQLEESSVEPKGARYDLSEDDWKELVVEGKIKYRMPCLRSWDPPSSMSPASMDRLSIGPDAAATVTEAHRRSNARIWAAVRPLCLEAIGDESVVELLGPLSCRRLVEKLAYKNDPLGALDERGLVAEVHAGLRSPPEPGEPQSPIFTLYMAMTSESSLFESELAESFGPQEARRIWHSMSCASIMN